MPAAAAAPAIAVAACATITVDTQRPAGRLPPDLVDLPFEMRDRSGCGDAASVRDGPDRRPTEAGRLETGEGDRVRVRAGTH